MRLFRRNSGAQEHDLCEKEWRDSNTEFKKLEDRSDQPSKLGRGKVFVNWMGRGISKIAGAFGRNKGHHLHLAKLERNSIGVVDLQPVPGDLNDRYLPLESIKQTDEEIEHELKQLDVDEKIIQKFGGAQKFQGVAQRISDLVKRGNDKGTLVVLLEQNGPKSIELLQRGLMLKPKAVNV